MKLLLKFGVMSAKKKEVNWNVSSNIRDFPMIVKYENLHWEFLTYDRDPNGVFTYALTFGELTPDRLDPYVVYPDINEMFNRYMQHYECQCGAAYERGFENIHSYWCPKWEKV